VPTHGDRGQDVDLIVKFSRFAQKVPLHVASPMRQGIEVSLEAEARFLNPFEEFGLLMELRRGRFGPQNLTIRTKRPLAIYCPAQKQPAWQLGRSRSLFKQAMVRLDREQSSLPGRHVQLEMDRDYIVVFHCVQGLNAQVCYDRGWLSEDELEALTDRVENELARKGFRVLDNKPLHFILRPIGGGELLRRHGELVYCLVDFELMERTEEYERWRRRQA